MTIPKDHHHKRTGANDRQNGKEERSRARKRDLTKALRQERRQEEGLRT